MDADQEELDANFVNHTNQDLQTAENADIAEKKMLHFVNSISTQFFEQACVGANCNKIATSGIRSTPFRQRIGCH
jgi:hypothetical protein